MSSTPHNTYETPKSRSGPLVSSVRNQTVPPQGGNVARNAAEGSATPFGQGRDRGELHGPRPGVSTPFPPHHDRSHGEGPAVSEAAHGHAGAGATGPAGSGGPDDGPHEGREVTAGAAGHGGEAVADPAAEADRRVLARLRGGVRLTGQRVFAVFFLVLAAMPLVFLAGLLAGRQDLEEELVRLSDIPVETTTRAPAGDGTEVAEEEGGLAGSILKPQDLAFSRFLRAAPGEKVTSPAAAAEKAKAVRPAQPAAPGEPVMAPGMSPARASGGPPAPPAQQAELFDFVFQMAAFSTEADAENLRVQLEAEGFRSRLERNGRLYIVLLLSRGRLERIGEVTELAQRLRLGAPIERSRRAVLQPIGQRVGGN